MQTTTDKVKTMAGVFGVALGVCLQVVSLELGFLVLLASRNNSATVLFLTLLTSSKSFAVTCRSLVHSTTLQQ